MSYILEKLHIKNGDTHADFIEYKKRISSARKYMKYIKNVKLRTSENSQKALTLKQMWHMSGKNAGS